MEEKLNVAVIAGGASKGDEIVGIFDAMRKHYDVYLGTSTGTLISLLAACGKYDELVEAYSTTTNREMYGRLRPFTKNGNWSARSLTKLWRLGPFTEYFYNIGKPLEKKLRNYFTKEDLIKLRDSGIKVRVCIENMDYQNDEPQYIDITDRQYTYEDVVKYCVASASIPGFAKQVVIDGRKNGDGGWNEPIPTGLIAEEYREENIDVFLTHSQKEERPILNPLRGPFKILKIIFRRFVDGGIHNRIKCLARLEILNLPNCNVFYSTYSPFAAADFNSERMRQRIQIGRERVRLNQLNPVKK